MIERGFTESVFPEMKVTAPRRPITALAIVFLQRTIREILFALPSAKM